jgi:hypothetical protein
MVNLQDEKKRDVGGEYVEDEPFLMYRIMFSVMYKRDGAQREYLYNLKVKTVIE